MPLVLLDFLVVLALKGGGVGAHGVHECAGHESRADVKLAAEIGPMLTMLSWGWRGVLLVLVDGQDVELALLVIADRGVRLGLGAWFWLSVSGHGLFLLVLWRRVV